MTAWETTWGTPVTVTDEIGLCQAYTLAHAHDDRFFVGTGHAFSMVSWRNSENWDFSLELLPQGNYAFAASTYTDLTGVAGQNVNGVDALSTLYTHTLLDANGLLYNEPPPFSLDAPFEEGATDKIERYTSAFARTFSITIPARGEWVATLGCGAAEKAHVDAAAEAYVQPLLEPFLGSKTSVTVNAASVINWEEITVNITGNVRDAMTFNNTASLTDAHRENVDEGVTVDFSEIEIDFQGYTEKLDNRTNIGDVEILYDNSASTEKRMLKIILTDCYILPPSSRAVGMDNSVIINGFTVKPTWNGTTDPITILYSTATTGGYTGW